MIDRIKVWIQKNFARKNIVQWLKAFGIAIAVVGGFVGVVTLIWLLFEWTPIIMAILALVIWIATMIKRYLDKK